MDIIGVNPFVLLPAHVLKTIFKQVQKAKGPIPACRTFDDYPFIQMLVLIL